MTKTLIVHIGIGKAGSTAIQKHFFQRRAILSHAMLQYWGLNLEFTKAKRTYPWQTPGGIGILQKMKAPQAIEELKCVLLEAIQATPDDHKAIWSNESIYERPDVYGQVLEEIRDESKVDLLIIGYARNHSQYTVSAYKQWGVKHKTNSGRILSFREWVNLRKDFLSYGKKLVQWELRFPNSFKLFNYDSAGDIVTHFLNVFDSSSDLLPSKTDRSVNVSPQSSELALFALYNNQFHEPVTPKGMQDILRRFPQVRQQQPFASLSSLFPAASDISHAMQLLSEDIAIVDEMLMRRGQPPLPGDISKQEERLTESEVTNCVLSALLSMIILQDQRIADLEAKIHSSNTS